MKLVRKAKPSKGARPWEAPALKWPGPEALNGTVFGQKYLTVTVDEAHQFRNIGTKQWAALELLDLAQVKILLTGTPLHTAPKVRTRSVTMNHGKGC
jgi:TATA-binding protein-associated factor